MTRITIDHLSKTFGPTRALDDVCLDLPSGAFVALLGASGCGKTTLLRLVAGFERPSSGRILFDDTIVTDDRATVPPEDRNISIVFQSYALWPHRTVAENVSYPLTVRGVPRAETTRRVADALDQVGLGNLGARMPDALSGGQRQRVALARALVTRAKVIVLDEPLANLDVHLKATMQEEFRRLHRATAATILYVTHDQSEALALADQVAMLDAGRIMQFASPATLYAAPRNRTVAGFIGRGCIVPANAPAAGAGHVSVRLAGVDVQARTEGVAAGPVDLLLRPETLRLSTDGVPATVVASVYRGPVYELEVAVAGLGSHILVDVAGPPPAAGSPVHIAVTDAWIVPAD